MENDNNNDASQHNEGEDHTAIESEELNKSQHNEGEDHTAIESEELNKSQHNEGEDHTAIEIEELNKSQHHEGEDHTAIEIEELNKSQHDEGEDHTATETEELNKSQHNEGEDHTAIESEELNKSQHNEGEDRTAIEIEELNKSQHNEGEDHTEIEIEELNKSQHNKAEDHTAIEIEELNKSLVNSIKVELDNVSPSPIGSCCVYSVHDKLRKINEYAYTPEMISIGPFHRGKESLQVMEKHKWHYVKALLPQTTTSDAVLKKCVESIRSSEHEIRKCYSEPIDLESDDFVKMMLVDGLFTIELFRKSAEEMTTKKTDKDDPIFKNIWSIASLVRDMVLLENQLPMSILTRLFKITVEDQGSPSPSLTKLALHFFDLLMPREEKVLAKYSNNEGKHLLDLLRKTFQVNVLPQKKVSLSRVFIPCVTELRHAGVKFKKGSTEGSFLDIKFSDGVLEIPPVLIQDQTDSLFRNFIAFEQSCDGDDTYMTSYAFLMDSLINSPNDVGFLRQCGIIMNYLGEDEDVSNLFNKLCSEVTLTNFYYSQLCEQVDEYYQTRWHVWKASLKRDYFNTPWAVLSFVAAILLLVLTLTGTLFSLLSFVVHKS